MTAKFSCNKVCWFLRKWSTLIFIYFSIKPFYWKLIIRGIHRNKFSPKIYIFCIRQNYITFGSALINFAKMRQIWRLREFAKISSLKVTMNEINLIQYLFSLSLNFWESPKLIAPDPYFSWKEEIHHEYEWKVLWKEAINNANS